MDVSCKENTKNLDMIYLPYSIRMIRDKVYCDMVFEGSKSDVYFDVYCMAEHIMSYFAKLAIADAYGIERIDSSMNVFRCDIMDYIIAISENVRRNKRLAIEFRYISQLERLFTRRQILSDEDIATIQIMLYKHLRGVSLMSLYKKRPIMVQLLNTSVKGNSSLGRAMQSPLGEVCLLGSIMDAIC